MKTLILTLTLTLGLGITNSGGTNTSECETVNDMLENYTRNKFLDAGMTFATKTALKGAMKTLFGASKPVASGIIQLLTPSVANPPHIEAFKSNLYNISQEFEKENPNIIAVDQTLHNLMLNAQAMRIEREFGDNNACYDRIDQIVKIVVDHVRAYKSQYQELSD